ncbi:ATP-binding cassette subfamily G member 4 isoform X3 [Halyomorpha halys]|uniref:ATP-binding cassette subfamily G member 4 isoform X3 n=1 Tax=Halyomorpha halys TaxID=286706 RepID=UPI0006D4EE0F|nr:ATP-binding cassette sub-family G member 4 isoform X2 [Halyomorpha halys]
MLYLDTGASNLFKADQLCRRRGVHGKIMEGTGRSSCYIAQEDIVDPMLTPAELMDFASRLKLPANYTLKQRAVVVENLISTLGLEDCINSRTHKLSGGQRKRLSIALELINNPPVLFLDEPTSGLDTVTTVHLIRLLSRLSRDGRTIVVTIHQPSASLFDLFDRVYLLAMGRCVYQGGSGRHLLKFLAINGFICPVHHNPADFVIELAEDKGNVNILSEAAKNGRTSWFLDFEVDQGPKLENNSKRRESDMCNSISEYKPQVCESFWIQFSTIFSRILLQEKRNKTGLKLQIYHHLCCSVALGIMFFKKGNDGTEFVSHLKVCMAVTIFQAYTMQTVPMLYYPFEVNLLKKEHFNKWYSLFPYFLAFTVAKAPIMVSLNLLDSIIVYSMIGLPWELDRFLCFCLIGLTVGLVADALGHTIGSLFSPTNSCAIGPFTLAPFIGLATYGYDFMKTIHPLMDVLIQLSYVRSGIIGNILVLFGLDRKELYCPDHIDYCLYKDPREIFHYLTLDRFSIPLMMLHLCINLCLFRLTFYLALKWRLRT